MKNCSKNSHVITTYNRQNSFHAINRLKIQHIDNILKLYFVNLIPMTKSSIISMDVKNWDDFDFNWIRNNLIALAQKKIFNNLLTNIIHYKSISTPNYIGSYLMILWDACSFKSGSVASTPWVTYILQTHWDILHCIL